MQPGHTLAHYRIVEKIGAGGMGEVYRAVDTTLDRDVAVKVLPRDMAGDSERLARFEREARTLASLQHPHIASIYGFEQDGENRFLVMELVAGDDLSDLITRRPFPVDEAVALATQLAMGLEAAHGHGIIHRDLKPANIKITPEGQVKILDFGLARAFTGEEGTDSGSDLSAMPTITAAMTQPGAILGTAAYMSPEQARGKKVDQRTDMWAFGVILFEMLTGKQLFAGETASDVVAAVLRKDLAWEDLPDATPPHLRRLLRRCLARNPHDRLRAAGDARLELQDPDRPAGAEAAPVRRNLLPAALGVLAIAILGGAWLMTRQPPAAPPRQPTHLSLALPGGLQIASRDKLPLGAPQPVLAISDDGRLVVAVVERDNETWLFRQRLDDPDGVVLEDSRGAYCPRVSPNGEWISFMAGNALMRMAADGDRATRLVELPNSFGHDWLNDDEIVINRGEATELLRLDAERGTYAVVSSDTIREEFFWPRRVPGTETILINSESHVAKSKETDVDEVTLLDLATGRRTRLDIGGSLPQLLPGGRLLLVRDGVLTAMPFDPAAPAPDLKPVPVLEGLLVEGWIGQFAVSSGGTMVYVPGEWLFGTELVWDDGKGNIEPLGFPLLAHGDFELSPDGTRLAITQGGGADVQTWIYDLERVGRRLLTTDGYGSSAVWSPDGTRLAYGTRQDEMPALYIRALGSTAPPRLLLQKESGWLSPYAWHETAGILYTDNADIHLIDPDAPGASRLLVGTGASEWGPDISPDGSWMAYTSDESGRYEIYARALDGDRSWSVSLDGGEEPIFSPDGRTIYYRNGNRFYATPILEASADGTRFKAGQPVVVVEGPYSNVPGISYDVGPDGRLLLLRSDGGTERPDHLNVILDWDVELAARMAAGK